MPMFDTTKWYQVIGRTGMEVRPLVPGPDPDGDIPIVTFSGHYDLLRSDRLIPVLHTVEWRKPKRGQRQLGYRGDIIVCQQDEVGETWVIIENGATT